MSSFVLLGALLFFGSLVVLLFRRLSIPPMVAWVVVGFAAHAFLPYQGHLEALELAGRIGVTALLFFVGLNIHLDEWKQMGKRMLRVGLVQSVLAFGLGLLVVSFFSLPWWARFAFASVFAFNSTMLAMKAMSDKNDLGKTHANIASGLLVMQDVLAAAVLLFVSSILTSPTHSVELAVIALFFAKVIAAAVVVRLIVQFALRQMSRAFARSPETLTIFTIAWPLGLAAGFEFLHLSPELGALVAGFALSGSLYRLDILSRMRIVRDGFLPAFFLLVGIRTSVTWMLAADQSFLWLLVVALVLFIIVLPGLLYAMLRILGYDQRNSLSTAQYLWHGSEFGILLLGIMDPIQHALSEVLTLAIVGSMVVGSFVPAIIPKFIRLQRESRGHVQASYDAFLLGCHRVGADFLHVLKKKQLHYIVVDNDPDAIERLSQHGIPCRYADASQLTALQDLGLRKARLVVSTIPDQAVNVALAKLLKKRKKEVVFLPVAQRIEDAMELYKLGADYVILPHFLGGNHAATLIERHGIAPEPLQVERLHHLAHLRRRHAVFIDELLS